MQALSLHQCRDTKSGVLHHVLLSLGDGPDKLLALLKGGL